MIVKGPLSVTVSPRCVVVAQPIVKVMKINVISVFMIFSYVSVLILEDRNRLV